MLGEGLPYKFHRFIFESLLFVLIIEAGEEPSIETHVSEKAGVCTGMPERIDVPSDTWAHSELVKEELMSQHHIVNHIFIVCARLVMHAPASVHKL